MESWILPVVGASLVLTLFGVVAIFLKNFVKVAPNHVLIVSGRRVQLPDGTQVGFRVVKGGGTFVFPMVERVDVLSLEVFGVDLSGVRIRVSNNSAVQVDCAAQLRIHDDDTAIVAAARHFLSKNTEEIGNVVKPILERSLDSALTGAALEDLVQNPVASADRVRAAAAADLGRLGLEVISLSLRNARAA